MSAYLQNVSRFVSKKFGGLIYFYKQKGNEK